MRKTSENSVWEHYPFPTQMNPGARSIGSVCTLCAAVPRLAWISDSLLQGTRMIYLKPNLLISPSPGQQDLKADGSVSAHRGRKANHTGLAWPRSVPAGCRLIPALALTCSLQPQSCHSQPRFQHLISKAQLQLRWPP